MGISLLVVSLALCSLTWCDHFTDAAMKRDLVYKSKQGLGLAKVILSVGQPSLELRFFDDHPESRSLECCPHPGERTISRNRILIEDLDYSIGPDSDLEQLAASALKGGQVIAMNAQGKV